MLWDIRGSLKEGLGLTMTSLWAQCVLKGNGRKGLSFEVLEGPIHLGKHEFIDQKAYKKLQALS